MQNDKQNSSPETCSPIVGDYGVNMVRNQHEEWEVSRQETNHDSGWQEKRLL